MHFKFTFNNKSCSAVIHESSLHLENKLSKENNKEKVFQNNIPNKTVINNQIPKEKKRNSKQTKEQNTHKKHPNLIPQSVGCLCVNGRHQTSGI